MGGGPHRTVALGVDEVPGGRRFQLDLVAARLQRDGLVQAGVKAGQIRTDRAVAPRARCCTPRVSTTTPA